MTANVPDRVKYAIGFLALCNVVTYLQLPTQNQCRHVAVPSTESSVPLADYLEASESERVASLRASHTITNENKVRDKFQTASTKEESKQHSNGYKLDFSNLSDSDNDEIIPRLFGERVDPKLCAHPEPRIAYSGRSPKHIQHKALKKVGFEVTNDPENPDINLWFPRGLMSERKDLYASHRNKNSQLSAWTFVPATYVFGDKDDFTIQMRSFARQSQETAFQFDLMNMYPRTYVMSDKTDCNRAFKFLHGNRLAETDIFFYKDATADQGKNIEALGLKQARELSKEYGWHRRGGCSKFPKGRWVLQVGVRDMMLIEGKKFDIRNFMLVVSYEPLLAYFHKGYLRRSVVAVQENDLSLAQHLINGHIQREYLNSNSTEEDDEAGSTAWSMERFHTYLLNELNHKKVFSEYQSGRINTKISALNYKMKAAALVVLMAMKSTGLPRDPSLFQHFGLDFLVDQSFNAWLIETNTNPGFVPETIDKNDLLMDMMVDELSLLGEVRRRRSEGLPIADRYLQCAGAWELIYDETCDIPWACESRASSS